MDFTGQVLSTFTDVKWPYHLSIDTEGRVLVADTDNDRILLLNSRLERVLIGNTNFQVELRWPIRLCYNELSSQLYVVHISSDDSRFISLFTLH